MVRVHISVITLSWKQTEKYYHDLVGMFFSYWNTIHIDLSKCQIFSRNDSYTERRQSVEVSCVYRHLMI